MTDNPQESAEQAAEKYMLETFDTGYSPDKN